MSKGLYIEAIQRLERLHRRLHDLVTAEFDKLSWDDINAVQALMLFHSRGLDLTQAELRSRGIYQGTNTAYNVKKLLEGKYLVAQRSLLDRRNLRLRLTPKGEEVAEVVDELLERHLASPAMDTEALGNLNIQLSRLERSWAEFSSYIGIAA